MSSTKVKDRQGTHLDFYETPSRVVYGLLEYLNLDNVTKALEPSAGRGAIIRAVQDHYASLSFNAIEIQEQFKSHLDPIAKTTIGNFLLQEPEPFDLILANPPFSQAEEFIKHAYKFLSPNGQMAFLLRLPFLGSVKRSALFKQLKPTQVLVLSQRPKFGGTNIDSCDYAWFVWSNPCSTVTTLDWILK
jgi:tRNA1(Val) A37 N6-methylase TrmN6